jgi:O-antigen ligase
MIGATGRALSVVPAWIWVVALIVLTPPLVAAATYRGVLGIVALAGVGAAGMVVTLARPLPFLLLYVALIPLESALLVGEAATVTRVVGIVFFGGYVLRRFGRIELRAIPLAGWLFVAWALLSVVWARDGATAITQLTTLVQLFVMTVVIADLVAIEPGTVRPILWTYTASATVTAALAIFAFGLGSAFLAFGRAEAFEDQDPAQFAAILVPAVFFLLFEIHARRRIGWAVMALVVLATAILLSGTRSAWLAVGVGFLVGVIPRLGRRATLPAVLLAAAAIAVIQIPEIGSYVTGRAGSALETGGAGRIDIWAVGIAIFLDNPILGVGFGNFPVAFTPEIIRDVAVPGLNLGILIPGLAPHSSVVGTLTELGVVGAGLLAAFVLATLLRPSAEGGAALKAALLALLVQSFLLDVFNRKQVWLVIAIALGLAWRAVAERRAAEALLVDERLDRVNRMRRTWRVDV